MGNVINISILDGMAFDLKTNEIIRYSPLGESITYHLFLFRTIGEYRFRHNIDLLRIETLENRNQVDNYFISHVEQYTTYTSDHVVGQSFEFRTEHHVFELVKYSSTSKYELNRVLASSNEENNTYNWIKRSMQIKVKPSTMDYRDLTYIFRLQ